MQYLAGISLGPVQGFIAAARETRDLAFGSQLLGNLAVFAARYAQKMDTEIIFPALLDSASSNKIILRKQVANQQQIVTLLQDTEHATRTELERLATQFVATFAKEDLDTHERAIWQILDTLEFYWAAVPCVDSHYVEAIDLLELTLAARKNTRTFSPNQYGAMIFKSSLTGTYESVIPAAKYPVIADRAADVRVKKLALADAYGIDGSEQLSGIDLFKRRGVLDGKPFIFPSLATMAARGSVLAMRPEQQHMLDAAWKQIVGTEFWHANTMQQAWLVEGADDVKARLRTRIYQQCRRADMAAMNAEWMHIDEQLAQRTGLPIDQSEHLEYLIPDVADMLLPKQSNLQAQLSAFVQKYQIRVPSSAKDDLQRIAMSNLSGVHKGISPYYALLVADGDHMGKFIHEFAKHGVSAHRALSEAMIKFAREVNEIATSEYGVAVYAGGDDMVVLVPVTNLLTCAQRLQDRFAAQIKSVMHQYKIAENVLPQPSISMGAVVAHFRESLQDALDCARETTKQAKRFRNALAISVVKRSGGDTTVVGHWQHFVPHMQAVANLWHDRAIPHGYVYDIQQMIDRLVPDTNSQKNASQLRAIIRLESVRILKQKRISNTDGVLRVFDDVQLPVDGDSDEDIYVRQLRQWTDELLVARMLKIGKRG